MKEKKKPTYDGESAFRNYHYFFTIIQLCLFHLLLKVTWCPVILSSNNDSQVNNKPDSAVNIQPRETKLEPRVAKFISLICNISMMKQQMIEIG